MLPVSSGRAAGGLQAGDDPGLGGGQGAADDLADPADRRDCLGGGGLVADDPLLGDTPLREAIEEAGYAVQGT